MTRLAPIAALLVAAAPPAEKLWTDGKGAKSPFPADLAELARTSMPAVVAIFATQAPASAPKDPIHKFLSEPPSEGMGTGFIIHPDGYILTNSHVIATASEIKVLVGEDQRPHAARVVGKDDATDVALLKIDVDHPLPVMPLGDSDALEVAEWVVAIGNPFGLSRSVTAGIVSFKGRRNVSPTLKEGTYFDFIQTDASINPGNSGGPLLNTAGEVVGINAAITQQGQGIGFAVPINMVKEILPQLAAKGRVDRAYVGVVVHDLDAELAASFGLEGRRGAVVADVADFSPAHKAGMKVGDVVLEFGGHRIQDATDLRWLAANGRVGSPVELVVQRDRKVRRLTVTLAEPPRDVALVDTPVPPLPERPRGADAAGLVVSDQAGAGVKIAQVDPRGPAYGAVEEGDVVSELNGETVATVKDFETRLARVPQGSLVRLYLRRGGERRFVAFKK